jgi:hypothetical protein
VKREATAIRPAGSGGDLMANKTILMIEDDEGILARNRRTAV